MQGFGKEELKGLKAELAALDRKIQLELAPPTSEVEKTEKSHEVKEQHKSENGQTESTVHQNRKFRVGF